MRKQILNTLLFLATGMMLVENTQAQEAPAANTQKAPVTKAAPAPPAGGQKTTAPKTGQAVKRRTQPDLTQKTQKDKVSYALGGKLGMNNHKQSDETHTTS